MNKHVFLIVFFLTGFIFAQKREAILKKDRPKADLISESQKISLQSEEVVQKPLEPSHSMVSIFLGTWKPTFLRTYTKSKSVDYEFEKPLNTLSANYDSFPLKFYGRWGFSLGPSYSYSEYDKPTRISLHVVGGNIALAYRGEFKSSQWAIPYLKYGRSYLAFIQRGADVYNTSESAEHNTVTLGVGFHLNRIGLLDSRNDSEILLQYQQSIAPVSENRNLNGHFYQIGGSLTL